MKERIFPRHPRRTKDPKWNIFDSSLSDYLRDFMNVDVDGMILNQIELLRTQPDSTVIDFLASTSALSDLHTLGVRGKFIAVGQHDGRNQLQIDRDDMQGIEFLQEDINTQSIWNKLQEKLSNRKAQHIMERGYGGLHFTHTQLYFHRIAMSRMWDLLDPNGGVLVVQTPGREELATRGVPIDIWLSQLNNEGIYAKFGNIPKREEDILVQYGVLILQKQPTSSDLPILRPTRPSIAVVV